LEFLLGQPYRAILLQEQFGGNAVVVTVFPDSNKKYLSTDLVKNEPVREEYLSPDVEFIDFLR
jgi:cysteine synthase A